MRLPFQCALCACAVAVSSVCVAPVAAQDASPRQRISSGALRERVRTAPPEGVTVPVEISKQGNRAVLQTADRAVPVANPDVLAQQVRQMPVQATVRPAPPPPGAGATTAVEVEALELQASRKWNERNPS